MRARFASSYSSRMEGTVASSWWVRAKRSQGTDIPLAAVLAVLGQIEVWALVDGHRWLLAAPLYLVFTGAIAFRRRYPLAVAVCVSVAANLAIISGIRRNDMFVTAVALLIACYSVAAYSEPAEARVGLAIALLTSWIAIPLSPGSKGIDNYAYIALIVGGTWILGRMLRRRILQAVALERRALEAEHAREDAARAAVAEERGRIARELHDIVAHGLSLMVVQAAAAEQILERHPEQAAAPLRAIQSVGREALGDMKRLLGLLRVEDFEAERVPPPSLSQVDRLVAQLAEAGLPVDLRVEGEMRALPAGLDVCGYRVVQEALTNSLKHGRPRSTSVVVRYGPDALELEVVDDGAGGGAGAAAGELGGGGHGLVGMRERVALYGGSLEADRRPQGGYAVRARLPLQQA